MSKRMSRGVRKGTRQERLSIRSRKMRIIQIFRALMLIATSLSLIFWPQNTGAEELKYLSDDAGQLRKAVDSNGITLEYIYDESGNLLEIRRTLLNGIAIFGF